MLGNEVEQLRQDCFSCVDEYKQAIIDEADAARELDIAIASHVAFEKSAGTPKSAIKDLVKYEEDVIELRHKYAIASGMVKVADKKYLTTYHAWLDAGKLLDREMRQANMGRYDD